MAKIDRLGWADGIAFLSYGLRVGVRVRGGGDVLRQVAERLPPGWKRAPGQVVDHLYSLVAGGTDRGARVRRLNLAYWNLARIARSRNLNDVLDAFESHLQLTVAEHAPRRVFVHSGVVGWKGKAILFPGLSYCGKTTLVQHLIRAGATYYSDEYAVLDERGRVHPYPRPLGLRQPNSVETKKVRPEKLGAEIGSKPLRVGLVVSTNYKLGSHWRPRQITRGKGVLELLANTVSARSQPELALNALPKALESAQIFKGVRGEASEVVASILALLD
jgi:hypothetical protein